MGKKKTVSLKDLPPSEAYNVASALRGPDTPGTEHLKVATTSALRSFVEEARRSGELPEKVIDTFRPAVNDPKGLMEGTDSSVGEIMLHFTDGHPSERLDWGNVRAAAAVNPHFMRHFWIGLYTLGRILPDAREYAVWLRNRIGENLGMGEPWATREPPGVVVDIRAAA